MSVFTYHLVKTSYLKALKAIIFPIKPKKIEGLIYMETMTCITLGSPIFSLDRFLANKISVFAQWENQAAIDNFFKQHTFGKILDKGWHTRLVLIRQWGKLNDLNVSIDGNYEISADATIVAVTIARMKFLQIPRFIRWGKPAEKIVKEHLGATLSAASIRFPNTISTFSIWKSLKEMTDMVYGHRTMKDPKRHLNAMTERTRKNFHYEFTTLRFLPIAEFGTWNGKTKFIQTRKR